MKYSKETNYRKKFNFYVYFSGEPGAGLNPFYEEIEITLQQGEPEGQDKEFEKWIIESLSEWYNCASVSTVKNDLFEREE